MQPRPLATGQIVQVAHTAENGIFSGCVMIVSEPKSYGAMLCLKIPGKSGLAYFLCNFANMEDTRGFAIWVEGRTE